MVNRGEEKVWVQMNVVPRSTGNTNSGTRELTLKCKVKCSVGRVTVDLIRRSWVRFPPRSKDFFLCLVWFPVSLYSIDKRVSIIHFVREIPFTDHKINILKSSIKLNFHISWAQLHQSLTGLWF